MTTQPTPAFVRSLPWSLLIAPRPGLALAPGVTTAMPAAPVTFYGWGGIGGDVPGSPWPDDQTYRQSLCRHMVAGLSRSANVPKGHRIVIGCERRTDWLKGHPERREAIDNLLAAIYWGMKAIHGPGVEVAFNGPEDATCGDFTTPMLGARSVWNQLWETRQPLPFVSRHYRPDAAHVAALLDRIAHGPGLSRGVVLWIQDYDAAIQRAELEYADAVDTEYTALQAKRGGVAE